MKKLLLFLCFAVLGTGAQAQLFGGDKVQEPASVTRVYLWDIPQTDKIYSIVSKDTLRVTVMYTVTGVAVYVLTPSKAYQDIKAWFNSSAFTNSPTTAGVPIGREYGVSYIGKISLLSKKDIKQLEPTDQLVAKAFNEKEKYTLLAQAPQVVAGKRNYKGNLIPDFTVPISTTIVHLKKN